MRKIVLARAFAWISIAILLSNMSGTLMLPITHATNDVELKWKSDKNDPLGVNQTEADWIKEAANNVHDWYWSTKSFTEGKDIEGETDDWIEIYYDNIDGYGQTGVPAIGWAEVNITIDYSYVDISNAPVLHSIIAHEVFHVIQAAYGWDPFFIPGSNGDWLEEGTAQGMEALALKALWNEIDPTYLDFINGPGDYMNNPDINLFDQIRPSAQDYNGALFWIYQEVTKAKLNLIFNDIIGSKNPFTALQDNVGGGDALKDLFRDYVVSLVTESRRGGLTKTSSIYPLSASIQIDEPKYAATVNAPQNRDTVASIVNLWGADFIKVNYKKISVPLSIRFDNKGNNDVLAVAVWRVGTTYHSFQLQHDTRTLFNVKNADEFVVAITQVGSSRTGTPDDYEIRITQSLDMIFTIDVTGSMWDDIDAVKTAATDIANIVSTKTEGIARFAIVAYRDFPYPPYGDPSDIMFEDYPFTNDATTIINNINALTPSGGADWPEAVFEALLRAINANATTVGDWIKDAIKFIILAGDAPHHEICPLGLTINDVIVAAEAADPVVIHSIAVGFDLNAISQFSAIASGTGGIFFNPTSPEEFADTVIIVIHEILLIPDLAVSLDVPAFLEPGTSFLLNATVRNTRIGRNETDVELQLLINGSIVTSVIIPELQANSSYTLSHSWTPTVEGIYNVTAYAPPLPEEENVSNNVASARVLVQVLPNILIVADDDAPYWTRGTSLPEFESALTSAGYNYFVWNESAMGRPSIEFLMEFRLVIWTCGDYFGWAVDPFDAATLESYLAQGGNVLLEGEDIGYDHSGDSFMVNVAHAICQVDDTGALGLTVTDPTHPVTQGLPTNFTWLTDPPYDDGVTPTNGGLEVICYTDTSWTAVTVFNGTGTSNGSVVYYAFPIHCLAQPQRDTLVNNSVSWLLPPIHDVAIVNVMPSKTVVGQGYPISINVTVENQGTFTETFNVTVYYNTTPINTTEVTLTSGNSTTATFTWDTTGVAYGNYTITAEATPVPGETDTTDNTLIDGTVTILPVAPIHDVAVIDVAYKTSYSFNTTYPGCSVNINVTVKNQGDFPENFTVTAYYQNTTADYPIGMEDITNLGPGENKTLPFIWDTTDVTPCQHYTIKANATVVPDDTNATNNALIDGELKIKMPGDVDGDQRVSYLDLFAVAAAYGSKPGDPNWDPECDFDCDGRVSFFDLFALAANYGEKCP